MSTDVMMAYSQECRDLTEKEVTTLVAKGVPEGALGFDQQRRLFKLRAISVLWEGPWFVIDNTASGERCIAIVCLGEHGEVADIAAWSPRSDRVGSRFGRVALIGQEVCTQPRLAGDKLWIREGVLDWLVHRRTGVVILNSDLARPLLTAASPVVVKTKAHKERLEAAWRAPRIQVVDDGVAASTTEAV